MALRYQYLPINLAKIPMSDNTPPWRGCGETGSPHLPGPRAVGVIPPATVHTPPCLSFYTVQVCGSQVQAHNPGTRNPSSVNCPYGLTFPHPVAKARVTHDSER